MGDRFDGALASGSVHPVGELNIPTALHALSLHETLVACTEEAEESSPQQAVSIDDEADDTSNNIVLFRAVQDCMNGGVAFIQEMNDASTSSVFRDAIKQSQMTSMLQDSARCEKFSRAISKVVRPGHFVLDIGAGTGLLSILAARAGAERVDAYEMFSPLACIARRVVRDNMNNVKNKGAKIVVHATHSTNDYYEHHMKKLPTSKKADVAVAEIFDSALLGEACLSTLSHAKKKLLKPDARIIPAKASVYARVITSEFLNAFYHLGSNYPLHRSEHSWKCHGGVTPIPIHIGSLKEGKDFKYISDTFRVFDFDFEHDGDEMTKRKQTSRVPRIEQGIPHAVVMWWTLDLVGDGTIVYSSAPHAENWQDHWLQMVYPLPCGDTDNEKQSSTSQFFNICASHDESSFRFQLERQNRSIFDDDDDDSTIACSCGWHALSDGPYRIQELASHERMQDLSMNVQKTLKKALEMKCLRNDDREDNIIRCLDISDGAICSLLASKAVNSGLIDMNNKDNNNTNKKKISFEFVSADDDEVSSFVHAQVARHLSNKMETENSSNRQCFASVISEYQPVYWIANEERDAKRQPFDVIMSEPYTRRMHQYPLATFGNLLVLRRVISDIVAAETTVFYMPARARIYAQSIRFVHDVVQKAFGSVGVVQHVNLQAYDELWSEKNGGQDLYSTCKRRRRRVSLPLFQYPVVHLSNRVCILDVDMSKHIDEEELEKRKRVRLNSKLDEGKADAVAIWVVYDDCAECRTRRYEVLILDERERGHVEKTKGLDLNICWDTESSTWDIGVEHP